MGDFESISKECIEDKYSKLQSETSTTGYLDHMVRAVEDYIYGLRKSRLRKDKIEIKNRIRADKGYTPTNDEKDILASDIAYFKIYKNIAQNIPEGKGMTFFFDSGAELLYSDEGSSLKKRIAIAHEIGHILLHFDIINYNFIQTGSNASTGGLSDRDIPETQASYFAKVLMNARTSLFSEPDFIERRVYKEATIVEAIKEIYPLYDEAHLYRKKD